MVNEPGRANSEANRFYAFAQLWGIAVTKRYISPFDLPTFLLLTC
jgi:hypothetical protein